MADALNLDGGWAIGEQTFAAIVSDIGRPPASLVEFGSGPSSVRWAMAFPGARVLAIEHDARWAARIRALVRERGVANLRVERRRLRWQWHGFAPYLSYEDRALPPEIDVVIVDGPPGATRRGREACLYQAMQHLRVGGRVYLDDYGRSAERRIGRNWLRRYPGQFAPRGFDVGHGVLVLEKQGESASRLDAGVWCDATTQALAWWTNTALWSPFRRLRSRVERTAGLRRDPEA